MTTHNMTLDELIDYAKKNQADARENQVKSICDRFRTQLKHGFLPALEPHNHFEHTDVIAEAIRRLNLESVKYELKAYVDSYNDIKIAIHARPRKS